MMVNGDDGSVMIDGTEVSPPIYNGGQEIAVDSQDKVHIVWHQEHWQSYSPTTCTASGMDVLDYVTGYDDGNEVNINGKQLIAEWTDIPSSQSSHTLLLKMRSGSAREYYNVDVWDGMGWNAVPPPGWPALPFHAGPPGWIQHLNLDPFLPNGAAPPNGNLKIRIHQPSPGGFGLYTDFIGLYQGNNLFPSVEVFYTKLDPSKDDQNGDAANEGKITLVQDKMLSELQGINSMWPTIAIDTLDRVHVPWYEQGNWGSFPYDLVFAIHDDEGRRLSPIIPITPPWMTYAGSLWYGWMYYPTFPYIDTDYYNGAHITWCDVRDFWVDLFNNIINYNIYHAYMNPDIDRDGLPLEEEINLGTNPIDRDSDNDGIRDGKEVDIGTDPLEPDTDGDGVPDGEDIDPLDPTVGEPEPEEIIPPIDIVLEHPGGELKVTTREGKGKPMGIVLAKEEAVVQKRGEADFTPLDLFLILFIVALAVTLVTTLQYQKRKMEALIKSRCVKGNQTQLLEVSDQMKESMEIKRTRKIRAGNMVEILDVKGNMVEIATEIGSFLIPADFLSCAEGLEEMDVERRRKKGK
jgi:hypothetical protein